MSVPSDVAKDVGNASAVVAAVAVAVAACRCCRASFSLISCSSSRSLLLSHSHAHGMEMRAFKLNCFKLAFLCFLVPMPTVAAVAAAAAAAKTAATSGQQWQAGPGCSQVAAWAQVFICTGRCHQSNNPSIHPARQPVLALALGLGPGECIASQSVGRFKWPGHHRPHLCTCCWCRHSATFKRQPLFFTL